MAIRSFSLHISCPFLFLTLLLVGELAAFNSMDEILSEDDDFLPKLMSRDQNWACRKCIYNHLDWSSCVTCFSGHHGSLVPYYSSYAKRSSAVAPSDFDFSSADEDDEETFGAVSKRARISSFLICRCCMSLRDYRCCNSCGFPAFYGIRRGKKSSQKRNYETSFLDMQNGNGLCSCCEPTKFDFVCCLTQCSKRRK